MTPHILNLGIKWRWVVSFTPRPTPRKAVPLPAEYEDVRTIRTKSHSESFTSIYCTPLHFCLIRNVWLWHRPILCVSASLSGQRLVVGWNKCCLKLRNCFATRVAPQQTISTCLSQSMPCPPLLTIQRHCERSITELYRLHAAFENN